VWVAAALALLVVAGVAVALIAARPDRTQVPNVVGSSISVATQRLQNDGFEVTTVRDNSEKPRNTVIGQQPAAGSIVDAGT
jgi:beta-lactam-binding protein with PASTA domain